MAARRVLYALLVLLVPGALAVTLLVVLARLCLGPERVGQLRARVRRNGLSPRVPLGFPHHSPDGDEASDAAQASDLRSLA